MLKIKRPFGRLIFNMGIAIPGKTVFLIETAPRLITGSGNACHLLGNNPSPEPVLSYCQLDPRKQTRIIFKPIKKVLCSTCIGECHLHNFSLHVKCVKCIGSESRYKLHYRYRFNSDLVVTHHGTWREYLYIFLKWRYLPHVFICTYRVMFNKYINHVWRVCFVCW